MENNELYEKINNKEIDISNLSVIELVDYMNYLEEETNNLDLKIDKEISNLEILNMELESLEN